MRRGIIFALSSFVLLLVFGLGIYQFSLAQSSNEQTWIPLSELVEAAQLSSIVSENTAPSADRESIADAALAYEQNDLLLVDFNTTTLCGRGGCALAGYRPSTGERILTVYVERTSGSEPIVEVVGREGFELPCLLVPPDPTNESIFEETERDILCYQNSDWSIQ